MKDMSLGEPTRQYAWSFVTESLKMSEKDESDFCDFKMPPPKSRISTRKNVQYPNTFFKMRTQTVLLLQRNQVSAVIAHARFFAMIAPACHVGLVTGNGNTRVTGNGPLPKTGNNFHQKPLFRNFSSA